MMTAGTANGYYSVEFRKAGLVLSKSSKKM